MAALFTPVPDHYSQRRRVPQRGVRVSLSPASRPLRLFTPQDAAGHLLSSRSYRAADVAADSTFGGTYLQAQTREQADGNGREIYLGSHTYLFYVYTVHCTMVQL